MSYNLHDKIQNYQDFKSFEVSHKEENDASLTQQISKSIFTISTKKDKRELKDEKIQSNIVLYKCPHCCKKYKNVTRYEVHLRTHTGIKPYICTFCNKQFNEKGNLKVHLRIHTGERPFKCTFGDCTMSFKTSGQLKDHLNHHSNLRPFTCPVCGAAFNRKTRLRIHHMIHTGEKPFECPVTGCKARFRERGNLNSHLKNHHNIFKLKQVVSSKSLPCKYEKNYNEDKLAKNEDSKSTTTLNNDLMELEILDKSGHDLVNFNKSLNEGKINECEFFKNCSCAFENNHFRTEFFNTSEIIEEEKNDDILNEFGKDFDPINLFNNDFNDEFLRQLEKI